MVGCTSVSKAKVAPAHWTLGTPIATYWAGPPMTEATARQMSEGGWNLVWCGEKELDTAQRFGLRAMLQDGLLSPASLDTPAKQQDLDALIDRVRAHPALYAYFITDEPSAARFAELGKLVAYLRQRDPLHLAYINLFPTYASNEQLGTTGDTVTAYAKHLQQYVDIVKPDLISYDHYHFAAKGEDTPQYFLNLSMIRQQALSAGVPFLNIVQACSWDPAMRIPNGHELRWLIYTSLAYGAQGISYYVYSHTGHQGAMALADGTPTPLYREASKLNREFVAMASQLQPLRSLAVGHVGAIPLGAVALPENAPVRLSPATTGANGPASEPGLACGLFGTGKAVTEATHAVIVNLNYKQAITTCLTTPGKHGKIDVFSTSARHWQRTGPGDMVSIDLQPGDGVLVRWAR
jgi:hypothetical protein